MTNQLITDEAGEGQRTEWYVQGCDYNDWLEFVLDKGRGAGTRGNKLEG